MTAEIYTEEFILNELKTLLQDLKDNEDFIYIGELFESKNYTRQRYHEWPKKFPDNKEIAKLSVTIKEILESRAIKGAMNNKLNNTAVIFHLKNNYNWKDKTEVDQTTKLIEYTKEEWENMSDEELEKLSNGE